MAWRLHEKAQQELTELRQRLLRLVGAHVLTAEQAQKEHWTAVRRLYATAVSDDGAECVAIKCNGCGKVNVIARDVQRYRCHCSPNTERFTVKSRQLDLEIGRSAVSALISPSGS